jgi:hypothetical protein
MAPPVTQRIALRAFGKRVGWIKCSRRPLKNHLQMMRCERGIVNEMEFRMSRACKRLSP